MSDNKKYYWLKLKTDFFNQREIKKLRRIAGGDTFTIIYLKLQLLSIKTGGVITFEQTESHLDEQLALELDEELENVRLTMLFLENNGLIEPISNYDYMMPKVVESIGAETDSAERVRRLRAKEKQQLALQCNGDVTMCNTEIEIELEKELNIELDKYSTVVDYYKTNLSNFPQIKKMTEQRKKHINARIKEYGIDQVLETLKIASESKFLNDNIGSNWLTFDWIINPNNFVKIIEGKYKEKVVSKCGLNFKAITERANAERHTSTESDDEII